MPTAVLPSEILFSIVSLLAVPELKAFRLCNWSLCKEAEACLFDRITVRYLRNDFERLKAIARHERLRLFVKVIDYVGDRFLNDLTMEQWRHHYNRDRHAQMNSMVWLRQPYREYQKISDEQKRLDEEDAACDLWAMAFDAFTNLREICLLMREYQKPNNGKLQSIVRRAFSEPDRDMITLTDSSFSGGGLEHLRSILRARLSSAGTQLSEERHMRTARIKTLHLENVHHCGAWKLEPERLNVSLLCSSLESLHISFAWDDRTAIGFHPARWWWLGSLLSASINLSELSVAYEPNVKFFLPLAEIWTESCARLESIEVSHVSFELEELVHVMSQHGKNLRRFKIEGADAFGTRRWKMLMAALKITEPAMEYLHEGGFEDLRSPHSTNLVEEEIVEFQGILPDTIKRLVTAFGGATTSYSEVQQTFTATWS